MSFRSKKEGELRNFRGQAFTAAHLVLLPRSVARIRVDLRRFAAGLSLLERGGRPHHREASTVLLNTNQLDFENEG